MTDNDRPEVGTLIRLARDQKGLTSHEVARLVDTTQSTIVRLEQGIVAAPKPALLKSLAAVLELDLADLYAAAGYPQPDGLPSFTPYLRSKYKDLPPEAHAELEQSFSHIAQKYGYDAAGPAPGQDEA
jgi:transcriptional regulator with XRE-family HTH domain